MSGSNEVVALKSLGISPWSIVWPTLVLAFFLSWLAVWLNDVAVTWGYHGARRVVLGAVEDIMLGRLQTKKEYSRQNFSVIVKDVDGRRLIEPTFTVRDRDKGFTATLRCQHATLEANGEMLALRCYNGSLDVDGEVDFSFPDSEQVWEFEVGDLREGDGIDWSPSYMALAEVYRRLDDHPRRMDQIHREHAVKSALQLVACDFDALTGGEWAGERQILEKQTYLYHRLRTEPPRRLANGFSCLSFVLVGSVMAIRLRNSNALSSFFVCFLPILVAYYPLLVVSVNQAKHGTLPPICVWLGNVVLAAWGLWLLRRVLRY
jgi:lipopolysaccharide export system permease protein